MWAETGGYFYEGGGSRASSQMESSSHAIDVLASEHWPDRSTGPAGTVSRCVQLPTRLHDSADAWQAVLPIFGCGGAAGSARDLRDEIQPSGSELRASDCGERRVRPPKHPPPLHPPSARRFGRSAFERRARAEPRPASPLSCNPRPGLPDDVSAYGSDGALASLRHMPAGEDADADLATGPGLESECSREGLAAQAVDRQNAD
jgi:hypothetical protein